MRSGTVAWHDPAGDKPLRCWATGSSRPRTAVEGKNSLNAQPPKSRVEHSANYDVGVAEPQARRRGQKPLLLQGPQEPRR